MEVSFEDEGRRIEREAREKVELSLELQVPNRDIRHAIIGWTFPPEFEGIDPGTEGWTFPTKEGQTYVGYDWEPMIRTARYTMTISAVMPKTPGSYSIAAELSAWGEEEEPKDSLEIVVRERSEKKGK